MKYKNIVCPGASITNRSLQPFQKRRDRFQALTDASSPSGCRTSHKAVSSEEWACPEGKIYSTESGGQDYGQHKVFEASRHRGRNVTLTAFSPSQEAANCTSENVQRRSHRTEPAAENAPGQYGKQDGKHGGKKSRDKGSGDQRYRRADKGIKPQEKSDGRPKKLPVSAFPRSRQKRTKQLACTNRLNLPPIRCPFSGYKLKRRTCMFSISMRPSPRA